ncbi:MAG: hypothetical protein AAGN66_09425 [Acidobacteriota bacterium]
MTDLGFSAALTVLGAFLGSVISPAIDIMFRKIFAGRSEEPGVVDGLVLLSAANAAWVVSFVFWGYIADSRPALITVIVLYVVAGVLFIGSFLQFRRAKDLSALAESRGLLLALVVGSSLWLTAESAEVVLAFFGFDEPPYLILKHSLLATACIVFLGGAALSLWRRE